MKIIKLEEQLAAIIEEYVAAGIVSSLRENTQTGWFAKESNFGTLRNMFDHYTIYMQRVEDMFLSGEFTKLIKQLVKDANNTNIFDEPMDLEDKDDLYSIVVDYEYFDQLIDKFAPWDIDEP